MDKLPISVVMLTLNEEYHLPQVLENVQPWVSQVFVVDSFSSDRTVEIAKAGGASLVQRKFTNFGDQWNFALRELPIATTWTMKLDPDERVDNELVLNIRKACLAQVPYDGYTMRLRNWFMGKPLHVYLRLLRLWKTGKCRFSDVLVNEHPIVEGSIGHLRGTLEHYDRPSLHEWFEKQNRYTTMEAVRIVRGDAMAVEPRLLGSTLQRRMYLKRIFFSVPFRYQLLYLYNLFCKGAWRDGEEGFAWAHLRTEVMRARELKAREIRKTGRIPIEFEAAEIEDIQN
jgi:hypothetical protein